MNTRYGKRKLIDTGSEKSSQASILKSMRLQHKNNGMKTVLVYKGTCIECDFYHRLKKGVKLEVELISISEQEIRRKQAALANQQALTAPTAVSSVVEPAKIAPVIPADIAAVVVASINKDKRDSHADNTVPINLNVENSPNVEAVSDDDSLEEDNEAGIPFIINISDHDGVLLDDEIQDNLCDNPNYSYLLWLNTVEEYKLKPIKDDGDKMLPPPCEELMSSMSTRYYSPALFLSATDHTSLAENELNIENYSRNESPRLTSL